MNKQNKKYEIQLLCFDMYYFFVMGSINIGMFRCQLRSFFLEMIYVNYIDEFLKL